MTNIEQHTTGETEQLESAVAELSDANSVHNVAARSTTNETDGGDAVLHDQYPDESRTSESEAVTEDGRSADDDDVETYHTSCFALLLCVGDPADWYDDGDNFVPLRREGPQAAYARCRICPEHNWVCFHDLGDESEELNYDPWKTASKVSSLLREEFW